MGAALEAAHEKGQQKSWNKCDSDRRNLVSFRFYLNRDLHTLAYTEVTQVTGQTSGFLGFTVEISIKMPGDGGGGGSYAHLYFDHRPPPG